MKIIIFIISLSLSVQTLYIRTAKAVDKNIDSELRAKLKFRKVSALPRLRVNSLEGYNLGQYLFNSKKLSGNQKISCSSCHQLNKGLGTGGVFPKNIFFGLNKKNKNNYLARNAPSLFNLSFHKKLFWDGRVQVLENGQIISPEKKLNEKDLQGKKILNSLRSGHCVKVDGKYKGLEYAKPVLDSKGCVQISHIATQVLFSISNTVEMRGYAQDKLSRMKYWDWLVDRVLKTDFKKIKKVYPNIKNINEVNIGHLARAIAEYVSIEFQSIDSPLDRYIAKKDNTSLSLEEKKGALVFFSDQARCTRCHIGPLLSDSKFHSVAIPQFGPGLVNGDDFGAYKAETDEHLYAFRTPSLRNLSLTAPYMHNGAFSKLDDVLTFYNNIFLGLIEFKPPSHPVAHLNFYRNKSTYMDRLSTLSAPVREPLGLSKTQLKHLKSFLEKSLLGSVNRTHD